MGSSRETVSSPTSWRMRTAVNALVWLPILNCRPPSSAVCTASAKVADIRKNENERGTANHLHHRPRRTPLTSRCRCPSVGVARTPSKPPPREAHQHRRQKTARAVAARCGTAVCRRRRRVASARRRVHAYPRPRPPPRDGSRLQRYVGRSHVVNAGDRLEDAGARVVTHLDLAG